MNAPESITCQECSTTFEFISEHSNDDPFHKFFQPTHCESCKPVVEKRRQEEEKQLRENQRLERIANFMDGIRRKIPPLFKKTDITHPRFNKQAWSKISGIRPTDDKPWIGFVGETGTCKTRIAYLKALELLGEMAEKCFKFSNTHDERLKVIFVSSYEITDYVMAQFSGSKESQFAARQFLDSIRTADFLIIDDLGKGRLSPAVAAEFFAIIDHRYQRELVTLWTANGSPEEIAANLSDDMAAPFAGRLNDSSRIYKLK